MRTFILMAILIIPFTALQSQNPSLPQISDPANFFSVAEAMNQYYYDNPNAPGYKQWKRKEWFLTPRLYPSGQYQNLTLKSHRAYQKMIKQQDAQRSSHGNWIFLGASYSPKGLGRLNVIEFHPTNQNIIYVGASNGGVWKTTNGGTTWTNISPHIPLLAIADIKLSPANPNVIFILTGDGDAGVDELAAHGQTEVSSIGILVSTDGGSTWHPTAMSFDHPSGLVPVKMLIHPGDVNTQFVIGETGILRTESLWQSWDTVLTGNTYDIEFHPGDPDTMYAGGDNWIARSTDNGINWIQALDADFTHMVQFGRVELAVGPDNPRAVYALAGTGGGVVACYQSLSSGANSTWSLMTTTVPAMGQFGTYCVGLAIDENDHTKLFGGMQHMCMSSDSGNTWNAIHDSYFVHADVHDIAHRHGALWVANDGGLYKSTDQGTNWTFLSSGLAITEIYRIAGTPQNTDLYFIGNQDVGTLRRPGGTSTFEHALGGDGMTCRVDPTNTNIVYASQQNGWIGKSTQGGIDGSFGGIGVPGGNGAWITPFILDPSNSNRIFVGKDSVYRSNTGGGNWDTLGSWNGSIINCLAQGVNNANVLYASGGSAFSSTIARTDNALVATGPAIWNNITSGLPNLFITGIAVDPANSSRVFVTLSGYQDGDKVFMSTNAGNSSSWVNISGSLPNVPVNCIAFAGGGIDEIYIGTDIGVFYRNNNIGDWIYYSNWLPAVNISDLYINPTDGTIVAGTYGRGLWRSVLYSGCVGNVTLSGVSPTGGIKHYSASNSISSSANYRFDLGTEIYYTSGATIDFTTGFAIGGEAILEAKLGPCPGITQLEQIAPQMPQSVFVDEVVRSVENY